MNIIVAGDTPLEIGKIEVLNLYNKFEKRRIDTACHIEREASWDEYKEFLQGLGIEYPDWDDRSADYPYRYHARVLD